MALSGQTNKLADEIQDILENGIESTGLQSTDGSPDYGGNSALQDFPNFTIYAINLDDDETMNTEDLPCIIFRVERTPIEYFHDDAALYQGDLMFEIRVDANETKDINGTVHSRKHLVSWFIERLEYILDHMVLTSVKEAGKRNTNSMMPATYDEDTDFWYYGETFMSVQYLEEGSAQ
jgi:hypothetical protein